jgi:hypothetical protein
VIELGKPKMQTELTCSKTGIFSPYMYSLRKIPISRAVSGGKRGYTPYAHQPVFKVAYTILQKVGARAYAHL